jgi:hypothetical protein
MNWRWNCVQTDVGNECENTNWKEKSKTTADWEKSIKEERGRSAVDCSAIGEEDDDEEEEICRCERTCL